MGEEEGAGVAPVCVTVPLFDSVIFIAPLFLPSPSNLSFLISLLLFRATADTKTDV